MAHYSDSNGYYWRSPKASGNTRTRETTEGQTRGNRYYNKKNRKGKRPDGQYGGKWFVHGICKLCVIYTVD